ncbi:MAG: AfsR/SARP family transcriptional regulator [Chloroflexota bacterium]
MVDMIGLDGLQHGIRLLTVTTRSADVPEQLLGHFDSRVVLQALDEDESIRLLGLPDAAELTAGGDLLLRVDGRRPIHARGFRVSPDHLGQLVELMQDAYGDVHERRPAVLDPVVQSSPATKPASERSAVPAPEPEKAADDATSLGTDTITSDSDAAPTVEAEPAGQATLPWPPDHIEDDVRSVASQGTPDNGGALVAVGEPTTFVPPSEPERIVKQVPLFGAEVVDRTAPAIEFEDAAPIERHLPADGMARVATEIATKMARASSLLDAPSASLPDHIDIRCFGGFSVWYGDREISPSDGSVAHHQAWEALALLAAQPEGCMPKERVLDALFPGVPPDAATNRLHTTLVRLRSVVTAQAPIITSDFVRLDRGGACCLNRTVARSDVQRFLELCQQGPTLDHEHARVAYEEARKLYRADLLTGATYEWLYNREESGISLQERYREDYYAAMRELARIYRQERQNAKAAELYRALLAAEPTLEDVAKDLFRCCAAMGDRPGLVREQRRLREALGQMYTGQKGELGELSPETTALYRQLLAQLDATANVDVELRASA